MTRHTKEEVQKVARNMKPGGLRDVDAGTYTVSEPQYPECTKLSENATERRIALEFLEWLEENGLHVCIRSPGSNFDEYLRTPERFDAIALKFIGVDATKIEEERRAMLKAAREAVGDGK